MSMARTGSRLPWVLAGGALVAAALAAPAPAAEAPIEFNRDIRPILSENCYACHGPDARHREAGLRLDVESGALAELDSGSRAVVPGNPDESELVFRVEADDESVQMPPPDSGKTLTPRQVALLRDWVAAGAPWEKHWSLTPIRRPEPPEVADDGFVRNPIDAFILDTLRAQGLAHAPEADRVTLLRRLSFDLTGLPPTPEEVDAFLADTAPDAYEKQVDRLLASPHFGERMAMFWLDLVRYADSVGYHGDQAVSVSPFRDYVIRAFNENKPFDQFTIEQLAGDLLPDPTLAQRVAAGYNRLGMMSAEGGVQPKEYLAKYAAERVRNIGGAWLGATLGCCECHDHKFDPFATRDFYRMEAFFADIKERGLYGGSDFGPFLPVPTPEQEAELARLDRAIHDAEAALDRPIPGLEQALAAWERTVNPAISWSTLRPDGVTSAGDATLTVLDDGSVLASGETPKVDTYTIEATLPEGTVTALRLEALPDDSLPAKGPGRAGNGNFVLTEITVEVDGKPVPLKDATATFEQTQYAEKLPGKALTAADAIDGNDSDPVRGWAVLPEIGLANAAVFPLAEPLAVGGEGRPVAITLIQNHSNNDGHLLGRFRLSTTTATGPLKAAGAGLPRAIRDALAVPPDTRGDDQRKALASYYRTIAPELAGDREHLASLKTAREALAKQVVTMLKTETVPPREIRVLPRGNWMDDSGEVVEPGVPAALPQPDATGRRLTRLDLARWLVAPENPLTARTLANRLWKLDFGAGLSKVLDDLGSQGDWPSHPELLDYLAGRLIDSGWDVKAIIRLIVTSSTYRQSSVPSEEQLAMDPTNRWLARQGRFRLDAELVRDTALSVSGLLVDEIGGPSVKPYQPPGYWAFLNFPTREWQNDEGPDLYRRGLYTHWQRQYLYPSFLAFDAPSREECTAERGRSNTPLQALVLLNDPVFVEAARALAERSLQEGGSTTDSRLDYAFRRALSRPATPGERAILADLHDRHRDAFAAEPDAARALLGVGEHPAPEGLDPAELAAWTDVARAILNLHATITRN